MKSASIEDVTEFVLDGTHGSPVRTETGIPVLSAQNVKNGTLDYGTDRYTSPAEYEAFKKRLPLALDDVLLTIVGTIGRAAVVDTVHPLVFQRSVAVLRPRADRLCSRFLYHVSQSQAFQAQLSRSSNQSSQAGVYLGKLKKLRIPFPPLPEQRRIAEILDKADALRAKRRAALAQLDTLTQSIFLDMFGDPATNPKGWPAKPLPSVCNCYSGGTPSKARSEYWVGTLPWFSPKDLKRDDLFDAQDHIAEVVTVDTSLRALPPETVAVVVRGMILAHTFPVSVLRVRAAINQDLKALLPKTGVDLDPQFLAHCLRVQSRAVLSCVSESAHGTKRLDADALKKITVLLTAAHLQRDFARRVSRVEACKATQAFSLDQMEGLFASLQQGAFRGELACREMTASSDAVGGVHG